MPFVEKLKRDFDLYAVKANQLEIINGKLSGKVLGDIVDAKAKADFLIKLCQSLNLSPQQAMAIGDGANDLNMMQVAGFDLAYKAKSKVQARAKGRINTSNFAQLAKVFNWQ